MINDMSVNQTYYVFGQINYTSASHVWERSWFLWLQSLTNKGVTMNHLLQINYTRASPLTPRNNSFFKCCLLSSLFTGFFSSFSMMMGFDIWC